jgi:hypothetical protein
MKIIFLSNEKALVNAIKKFEANRASKEDQN